ncbi:hypothetical protein Trydic_g17669 [Trypoxylus dichotomus]
MEDSLQDSNYLLKSAEKLKLRPPMVTGRRDNYSIGNLVESQVKSQAERTVEGGGWRGRLGIAWNEKLEEGSEEQRGLDYDPGGQDPMPRCGAIEKREIERELRYSHGQQNISNQKNIYTSSAPDDLLFP